MKPSLFFILTFAIVKLSIAQTPKNIDFGTDTTFEVSTWNIEHFPKNGPTTISLTSQVIEMMNIDFLALQEIESETAFNDLVENLTDYSGYWAEYYYSGMAFLYKPELVTVNNTYKILTGYDRELPRAPLVAEITVGDENFVIINNHYKCCGDGHLDHNDPWDEEKRRYDASVLIQNYIENHFASSQVILLGDLNDEINDDTSNNVFQPFLDDTTEYLFADMSITNLPSSDWSYPTWPSHLDHILVTDEIFTDFANETPYVACIKPDEVIAGGWSTYEDNISDHRPVGLRIALPQEITSAINLNNKFTVIVYPNPADDVLFIKSGSNFRGTISLINSLGQLVLKKELSNKYTLQLNTSTISQGIYYLRIESSSGKFEIQKIVVNK